MRGNTAGRPPKVVAPAIVTWNSPSLTERMLSVSPSVTSPRACITASRAAVPVPHGAAPGDVDLQGAEPLDGARMREMQVAARPHGQPDGRRRSSGVVEDHAERVTVS